MEPIYQIIESETEAGAWNGQSNSEMRDDGVALPHSDVHKQVNKHEVYSFLPVLTSGSLRGNPTFTLQQRCQQAGKIDKSQQANYRR